jgi:hypothetical protein
MFSYEDENLKGKCAAACRRLQSNIGNITAMMPSSGGPEDVQLKKLFDDVLDHVQVLLDYSTSAASVSSKPKVAGSQLDQQVQMAMKKLNAEAEVYKRRAALEEAQEEVRRLDSLG